MRDSAAIDNDSAGTFAGFPPSGRTECPVCDYSLEGLPAAHKCPECGFDYDEETRVWIPSKSRFVDWRLLAAGCYGLMAIDAVFDAIGPRGRIMDYVGAICLGVGSLTFFFMRGREAIVLTKSGFSTCSAGRWRKTIGWDEITHVEVASSGKRRAIATFRGRNRKVAYRSAAFDSVDDARDCQRDAEALICKTKISKNDEPKRAKQSTCGD